MAPTCHTHVETGTYARPSEWEAIKATSTVRVQWDPDRCLTGERLSRRAIQIGLSGPAARSYADEWVTGIRDITALARQIEELAPAGRIAEAARQLPAERVYPLSPALAARIGADPGPELTASGVCENGAGR